MIMKRSGLDALNIKQREWIPGPILLLIATSDWALIIWIIKQTNTNIAYQTNKLNK